MEKVLHVCSYCNGMHQDETDYCQQCGCNSIRIVQELGLLEGLQWEE